MDVPDVIEEIIELLLSGLKDTVCLFGRYLYLIWLRGNEILTLHSVIIETTKTSYNLHI